MQTKPTFVSYDAVGGVLQLEWISAAACSTTSDAPPPPPPTDDDDKPKDDDKTPPPESTPPPADKGGMGFFSWFFMLSVRSLGPGSFEQGGPRRWTEDSS